MWDAEPVDHRPDYWEEEDRNIVLEISLKDE
jgi:hypothetical protein